MAEKKNINEPVEVGSSERYQKNRENNQARLKQYRDAGYRAKDGDYVYSSPSGERTNVLLDGSLLTDEHKDRIQKKRYEKGQERINQANNGGNNGGETAGSTVPQNAQNATQNQNGTSVSNGNTNAIKYDGTDGNGNITVGPQNANLNYYQYGDDSNPNQQGQKGGMNEKYTGEGVSNSYIEYNPDITLADLDPNYLYGENARQQNRKEAGYIARRNDMIASALYNEGKVSKEEVAEFLSQQNEWMNSTEADRLNTIESVWKRLGQIQPEQPEVDLSKAEDIVKDTSGKIYGKTTAEEGNPREGIDTLSDMNSVFKAKQESDVRELQNFVSLNPEDIATCINNGVTTWSEQTWRDAQKYYPDFISLVNEEVKKQRGQQNIDSISMGGSINLTSQLTASENNVTTSLNSSVNKAATGSGAGTLATNINNALADSEIVSGAREQMEVYKRKIVEIQQAAEDLPALAQQSFKGDVPQYMVNAFINNRMQQLNKELQKYQNLYNASLDEAKLEIAQTQWREEMNYKWANLQADKNYKDANLELSREELEYNKKKAAITNGQWNKDGTYSYVDLDGVMHTLSAEEAKKALNDDLYNFATEYIDTWSKKIETAKANGQKLYGGQCEQFTDNFARQYFGTEMKGKNGGVTTAEEKAAYATEALPQRGFIAVWNYGENANVSDAAKKYGHTGIVIDYDQKTGTFTTIESNVDGQGHVEIRTHSINDAKLQGFRDPSQGANTKGGNDDRYYYYDTPMMDLFVEAYNGAKTAGVRDKVDLAREAYSILNELNEGGYIDALINNEVLDTIMTNIKNRNFVDNDGNIIWDTIKQTAVNETQDPDMSYAIDRIHRLVEIKLRKESGAAINISEWLGNFDMYMPQVGQDADYKFKRLQSMEHDMVSGLLPTPYADKYVPIIAKDKITSYKKKLEDAHDDLKEKIKKNK